jgi:hypothetical protein
MSLVLGGEQSRVVPGEGGGHARGYPSVSRDLSELRCVCAHIGVWGGVISPCWRGLGAFGWHRNKKGGKNV